MIPDKHYWRTRDGRIVPDGDPDAATLAYPKGHEVPDAVAEKVGLLKAASKQAEPPENKMRDKPADKAASAPPLKGPGSGVTAWREHAAQVTDSPVESWDSLSRDEIIELLDSEGVSEE